MSLALKVTRAQLRAFGELAEKFGKDPVVIEDTNLHHGTTVAVRSNDPGGQKTFLVSAGGKVQQF